MQNVQVCYIGIYVPWWFAVSITPSSTLDISPNAIPPQPPTPAIPTLVSHLLTVPSVWCYSPCVHVFSLFNTHLWVRTCGILFSVLVSVCWEWWSPGSFMSLQTTRTHRFWLLHNITWCICPHFPCPAYHQWAFGLVPGLCYCEQCCNKHTCACIFLIEQFIILWVYTQ